MKCSSATEIVMGGTSSQLLSVIPSFLGAGGRCVSKVSESSDEMEINFSMSHPDSCFAPVKQLHSLHFLLSFSAQ